MLVSELMFLWWPAMVYFMLNFCLLLANKRTMMMISDTCGYKHLGPVFPQQITDDLIDELPVEKRHLSKLIIICRI